MGWRLLLPAGLVTTVLLIATWHAGRESGQLEGPRLSTEINGLTQKIAATQLELEQQRHKNAALEQALHAAGKSPNLGLVNHLQQQLLQTQAAANQYRTINLRERQKVADDGHLVEVLSTSGCRLLALRGSETAGDALAYALIGENGRILLVASRLPKLASGKQFQLWVARKQESKMLSAGVFRADDNSRAVLNFHDASLLTEIEQLAITEEPDGGSSEPTGAKLFESE